MQSSENNLSTRPDTFFGICEAFGEDLRIPANLLRVALALLTFWNPVVGIGTYVASGVLVAVTRWLYPNPRIDAEVVTLEHAPVYANEQEPVALAA